MKSFFVCIFKKLYKIKNPKLRSGLISVIGKIEGGQAFSESIRTLMLQYHGIEIGIGTYGPCFNLEQTWTGFGNLTIGKYTSIARGVCIYTRNHPYWNVSTSPLFYNSSFGNGELQKDCVPYGKLTIGNDVWIGQYAVILPSCKKIGDGAVIGAGTIVTKDIPDYAIVAGNPGKVLKYRFDEKTIAEMKKVQWWNWDVNFIRKNIDKFQDYDLFCELVKEQNQNKINC